MAAWNELIPGGSSDSNWQIFKIGLPAVPHGYDYLTVFFKESGYAEIYDKKLIKLSYRELEAWKNSSKLDLEHIEIQVIRAMSAAFVAVANGRTDAECPLGDDDEVQDRMSAVGVATWVAMAKAGQRAQELADKRAKAKLNKGE